MSYRNVWLESHTPILIPTCLCNATCEGWQEAIPWQPLQANGESSHKACSMKPKKWEPKVISHIVQPYVRDGHHMSQVVMVQCTLAYTSFTSFLQWIGHVVTSQLKSGIAIVNSNRQSSTWSVNQTHAMSTTEGDIILQGTQECWGPAKFPNAKPNAANICHRKIILRTVQWLYNVTTAKCLKGGSTELSDQTRPSHSNDFQLRKKISNTFTKLMH